MKKIGIMFLCCVLAGCVERSDADYNYGYNNPYGNNPYAQPVNYGAQPVQYYDNAQYEQYYPQSVEYSQPMEYTQPEQYYPQPVEYMTQPEMVYPQPVEYSQPLQLVSTGGIQSMPYDIQPYADMYQNAAAATADTNTNHYPPALPKRRPYRRPL